jgi:hypothetical protein
VANAQQKTVQQKTAQRKNDSAHRHQRHAVYATETSGLLLVALLLLVLIIVRYWHAIHWSVR